MNKKGHTGGFEMLKVLRENWRLALDTMLIAILTMLVIAGFASIVTPY
jgi:hypothetical protein